MSRKLYIGNLPFSLSEEDIQDLFSQAGEVASVKLVVDPQTNRKRGFGFVEMATDEGAQKAIETLHNAEVEGRNISVAEAREREPRTGGHGGGHGHGGGRGGFRDRGGDRGDRGSRSYGGGGGGGGRRFGNRDSRRGER